MSARHPRTWSPTSSSRIAYDKSAVSLFESGEQCYIKAIISQSKGPCTCRPRSKLKAATGSRKAVSRKARLTVSSIASSADHLWWKQDSKLQGKAIGRFVRKSYPGFYIFISIFSAFRRQVGHRGRSINLWEGQFLQRQVTPITVQTRIIWSNRHMNRFFCACLWSFNFTSGRKKKTKTKTHEIILGFFFFFFFF